MAAVNLSPLGVTVAQVVYNPHINNDFFVDLVAGKPAVVGVDIVSSVKDYTNQTPVVVEATLHGQVVARETLPIGAIDPLGFHVDLFEADGVRFAPSTPGPGILTVTVDASNSVAETDETDNRIELRVDVKPTRALSIAYVPVTRNILGPLYEFETTVDKSNEFIAATYPVAAVNSGRQDATYEADALPVIGLHDDILKVGVWGCLAGFEKAIGVVPSTYFPYHAKKKVNGVSFCNFSGGLVEEGYWTVAAHELGHMFGLRCDPEEYESDPPGILSNGFWVDRRIPVSSVPCFMGFSPDPRTLDTRWIDVDDYKALFRALRTDPVDPEALLVAALVHRDGTVDLRPWYFMPATTLTESVPGGNYAVRVTDAGGSVLWTVEVPVDFRMMVEPTGPEEVDVAPLLVTIPFPETAVEVQIARDGRVLAAVGPGPKLLVDAISAIPDFGFTKEPRERRNALLNKAEAIARMAAAHGKKDQTRGELMKLTRDLRERVESWLVDGYVKTTPLQVEKAEVLRVIDEAALRLANE